MKKILFTLLILAIAGICYAMIPPTSTTALNDSSYTAITVPITNKPLINFAAVTDDSTAWYIADNSSGTNAALVTAPGSISYENVTPEPDGTIFYAKAAAGTPNLGVVVGYIK